MPEWAHLGKGGAQPAPEQVPCKAVSLPPPCFWIPLQVCASPDLLQWQGRGVGWGVCAQST